MQLETSFVFALIVCAAVLFATNLVRLDIVALLVVLTLMLSGVLTPAEAVAGFGDSVVVMVACLLVVGEMLVRTGVAKQIANWILRIGGASETRLIALLMVTAAFLSGVMSSTAVVAIFIPIVVGIAERRQLQVARMLMPLSFGALIGGMLTLIATPPNLIVSSALAKAGFAEFAFFGFFQIGVVVLAIAVVYMLVIGRQLTGSSDGTAPERARDRTIEQLADDFLLDRRIHLLGVPPASPLVGQTVDEADLQRRLGVRLIARREAPSPLSAELVAISPSWAIEAGSELYAVASPEAIGRLDEREGIECRPAPESLRGSVVRELGVAVVLIHPESQLIGKRLDTNELWDRHGVHAIGGRRSREALAEFDELTIAPGDALLVTGEWDRLGQLTAENHDFVVLNFPAEMRDIAPARHRAPVAIAILAGMVILSVLPAVPVLAAVMLAALAAVATRCLTMEDAYHSIHWSSIVLLAGMLPVATALDKTGGTELIVGGLASTLGDAGPLPVLSLLFWLTAILGLFLSNTATSVVMAPIAIQAAQALEISPYPLAVAVVVAASAGFASPVSSPVVTLIVEPGRYRFTDFVRAGLPLMALTYLVVIVTVPVFFPFSG